MLSSLKRSQQLPTENLPEQVSNVMGQPPEVMSQAPQEMSQRREKGKGPLGFPPVKLLPTEITPVPHPGNLR